MKLLFLLAQVGLISTFAQGFDGGRDVILKGIELDDDAWEPEPVEEFRSLRGKKEPEAPPSLLDFRFNKPPPQILLTLLPIVEAKFNSLILSRPGPKLKKKVNVNKVCNIASSEPITIKPKKLQSIPIYVGPMPSDGVGDIIAAAGPCVSYTESGFTRTAVARLLYDPADINDEVTDFEEIKAVLVHEVLHALGFGVYWDNYTIPGLDGPWYTGSKGVEGYTSVLSEGDSRRLTADRIPLENEGRRGAYGSHWRSSVFGNEIMTGFLDPGKRLLSKMTAKSLEDIGFSINYDSPVIDPYTVPEHQDASLDEPE